MYKNIPTRLSKLRSSLPWVNRKIMKMLRQKKQMFRQVKTKNNWTNYRQCQREIKRAIRKAEYNYIDDRIEKGLKKTMTVNLFGVTSNPGNRITLACHPLRINAYLPAIVYKKQTSYDNSFSQSLLRNK